MMVLFWVAAYYTALLLVRLAADVKARAVLSSCFR